VRLPPELSRRALERAVTRFLGHGPGQVSLVEVRQIHDPFNQTTAGLYRLSGTASDSGTARQWSLIAKAVHASDDRFGSTDDRADPNYWAREALLYRSGMLDDLPSLRAPRCFGVDLGKGTAVIWLEDIARGGSSPWTEARCELAAHCLGRFNGAYLAGRRPLPSTNLVTSTWHRDTVEALPDLSGEPLWERRVALLDVLDRLPQTFCHLDAFSRNLFVDEHRGDVRAVDWSYAGIAPVGAELAPLVVASVCFYDAEPDDLETLETAALDGYTAGLRAAGWQGDPALARVGYAASAAARYGLFPMAAFLADDSMRTRFERIFEHSAEDIASRWSIIASFLLDRADRALRGGVLLPRAALP
jgi:hypothetical protein